MDNLKQMMEALGIDPWLRAEYLENEAECLRRFGVDPAELSLLNAGDVATDWNPCTVFSEPGSDLPDPDPPPEEEPSSGATSA